MGIPSRAGPGAITLMEKIPMLQDNEKREGGMRGGALWALIAMVLGLPLPIVALFFMCGGCATNQ